MRAPPRRRHARVAPRRRVGVGERPRQRRRGLHRVPAPQARPGADRDGPRRRLPVALVTGWFGRLSIRARLMVIGLAGVAGALLIGGALLYAAAERLLALRRRSARHAPARRTSPTSSTPAGCPSPVPVSGALVVQVLDGRNRVRERLRDSGPAHLAGHRPPSGAQLVVGARCSRSRATGPESAGRCSRSAYLPGPAAGRVLVVAAVPTADLETSRRVLRTLLLVFFPLFLVLIAADRLPGHRAWRCGRWTGSARALSGSATPPTSPNACRCWPAVTRSARWPPPSTRCSAGCPRRTTSSGRSSPTRPTSCAAPSPRCRPSSRWPSASARAATCRPTCSPRCNGSRPLVEDLLVLARSGPDAPQPPHARPLRLVDVVDDVVRRYAGARVPVRRGPSRRGRPERRGRPGRSRRRASAPWPTSWTTRCATPPTRSRSRWRPDSGRPRLVVRDDGERHTASRTGSGCSTGSRGSTRPVPGTRAAAGSGLAITRELLRRNGARVWLEDGSTRAQGGRRVRRSADLSAQAWSQRALSHAGGMTTARAAQLGAEPAHRRS